MASENLKAFADQAAAQLDLAAEGFASLPQAQAFLQVGRSKLYVMLENGELPSCKVGGLRRIPWVALKQYAAKCLEQAGVKSA